MGRGGGRIDTSLSFSQVFESSKVAPVMKGGEGDASFLSRFKACNAYLQLKIILLCLQEVAKRDLFFFAALCASLAF